MFKKIRQVWQIKELRHSIFFVFALLAVFRFAAHIPIPGVNLVNLKNVFDSNQVLGLLNIMSGGAMTRFSLVALGIGPYITSSIIFQLLAMIIPSLEELAKEGAAGQRKINQYTRLATVPLALLQSYGMISLFRNSSAQIMGQIGPLQLITIMITMTAGSMFLVWIGELIDEKRIGNGISLIIFAGIVARIPTSIQQTLVTFDISQLTNLIIFAVISFVTVIGVVIITEGSRHIPVSYARRVRGNRLYGGTDSYLPLKVNQTGMIPIIFAVSLVLFPPLIAQFLLNARSVWLVNFAQGVINLFQNQIFYGIIYFALVFIFTYFYTSIIFHPQRISDNLQKQGGFIPGIRPGASTSGYLKKVSDRIMLAGALFLGLIAILPIISQGIFHGGSLVVGGAALLIVVSVVMETVKQIDSQLAMREYEKF
ncbi:MAG: preprotein translocase subunit SecY [Candidatus Aenigmarchaeota archaeon]|nr:preprotein translocase subunit SecY [Candidatus Aenigmarchaeota archaeon]